MIRSNQGVTMKLNSQSLKPGWSPRVRNVSFAMRLTYAHVSIRFVAVTWFDLPSVPETADDDSEAQNYRQLRNQYDDQNAGFSVNSDE